VTNAPPVSTLSLQPQATIRAGIGSSAPASVWQEAFINQDDLSPALSRLRAQSPKARLRARPETDDQLEVKQPDRKGRDEPYD
jgi:hypothetical protein